MRFRRLLIAVFCGLTTASRIAAAADPQSYKVEFDSTRNGAMDATIKATSDLQALRASAPVSPFGLISRARNEVDRLSTVLESYGYYQARIDIRINGLLLSDPNLGEALTALPKGSSAKVAIAFALGTRYTLRRIEVEGDVPAGVDALAILDLHAGEPALAAAVLAGGTRLLSSLQEQGYAFAKVEPPVAYEAAEAPVLDLKFQVDAGAQLPVGDIHIQGLKRVHESLVRKRLTLRTGDPFKPSVIDRARRDLLALNVFGQVSVELGTQVDGTGGVPVTFKMSERKRRAVTVNAAYSSDLGGSGGATWTDRDVFGDAQVLSVKAAVTGLGGSDTTGAGYDTAVSYLIPEFGHRDQSLQFSVVALKAELQAYDQTSQTISAVLSRKVSSIWTVTAGLSATDDHIVQEDVPKDYTLIALPFTVAYDSTDLASPLDDPHHGYRASVGLTPTLALGHPSATFIVTQVKLATYYDIGKLFAEEPGRTVLATRGLVGLAQGASEFSLPPDQRFYGGGSATIRGYAYQSVGPIFYCSAAQAAAPHPSCQLGQPAQPVEPTGGTAITAAGIELRQRFGTNFGAAVFIDAGQVSAQLKFLPNDLSVGAGAGIRYYTPIGPIRFDVALPLQRRAAEDAANQGSFEIYIGLGQAF